MERALGKSGLTVCPIGLGAMPLSIEGRPGEAEAIRVICEALDAGLDLIDTADAYCLDESEVGHNERLIGKALREWRGHRKIVIATKGGIRRPQGEWVHDGSPEHLRTACEASLRALGLDRIPLYQLHAPDPAVPFEETVGALADLRDKGLIGHVGLSNVDVDLIRRALAIVSIVSVQNQANPYYPDGFTDGVIEFCETEGIAFVAYSPLGGWRAGRIAHEPTLQELGSHHNATPYQVVLAWLLSHSPALIPIPGASRVESALGSASALKVSLNPIDIETLDRAFITGKAEE